MKREKSEEKSGVAMNQYLAKFHYFQNICKDEFCFACKVAKGENKNPHVLLKDLNI